MAGDLLIHDDSYLRKIFFSIVFLGVIVTIFIPTSSYYGYTIIACGMFMIVLVFFEYIIRESANTVSSNDIVTNLKTFMKKLIRIGTPVFLVFGVIIYLLTITLTYNKMIVSGDVTPEYIRFRNISAILLIIESLLLNTYISQKRAASMKNSSNTVPDVKKTMTARAIQAITNNTGSLIILFAVLHMLVALIIDINLKYFTTEGFCPCKEKHKMNEAKNQSCKKIKSNNEIDEERKKEEQNMYKLSM